MGNASKALEGAGKGFALGWQLGEGAERTKISQGHLKLAQDKYEDAKLLSDLQVKIANKKADAELIKLQNERMTMGFDFAKMFITPEEGVTKNQMDSFVQGAKAQFNIDFSSVFQPITDEKTGNPVGFKLESEEVFKKRIDDANADADRLIAQTEAATNAVKAKQAEAGIFDTPEEMVSWAASKDPKMQKLFETNPMEYTRRLGQILSENYPGKAATHTPVLAKGMQLEIEKKLSGLTDQIHGIANVKNTYLPEMLTYKGQVKKGTLNFAAKVAGKKGEKWLREKVWKDSNEKFLGQAWEMHSELGKFFDAYRLEVTKSQAAMRELDMLRQNVMNSDMSQPEFEYNIDKAQSRLQRQQRILRYAHELGFTGQAYWDKVDEVIGSVQDPTLEPDVRNAYGDKLERIYRSQRKNAPDAEVEQFVLKTLREEGYLN